MRSFFFRKQENMSAKHYKILFMLFLIVFSSKAQEENKLVEFFTLHTNKKALKRDTTLYPSKIILAPVINYTPETKLGFGVGAKFLFKPGHAGDNTRTSNVPISALYTLENQFILFSGYEVFFNEEQWMLEGNIKLQDFPRFFYGIGRDAPIEAEEEYSFAQILIEPILLKRAFLRYLFLGGGIRYNKVTGVEAIKNGKLENINYSGALGATSVGIELAAVYDSRNNLLNTQSGFYFELTHGFYGKVFGGTNEFELTKLDMRYFTKPFSKLEDVLAFQLKMHFTHGDAPLTELALFGSQEIMRGYYEGRFIDRHLVAAQVEYRKNITGRLGAVVFLGAGDVANSVGNFNFKNLRPTAGIGLRFLIERKEKLNVRFDWGFGRKTNNYYLNIAEAF